MELNVLYNSSEMYYRPLYISVWSLLKSNQDVPKINIYIINDGFSQFLENKLRELVNKFSNADLFLIYPDRIKAKLKENHVEMWAGSYSAYYKLFIEDELKHIDRVIYIDSDTIVCGNLLELMELPMDNFACAMAYELINSRIKKHYGVTKEFFNSGIVLINLQYWRKHKISDLLSAKLSDSNFVKELIFADQDLMILSIYNQIGILKPEYNYTTMYELFYSRKFMKKNNINLDTLYSYDEYMHAKNNPKIIHYLDIYTGRPWEKNNNNPFKQQYSQYTDLISFEINEPKRNRNFIQRISKNLVLLMCKVLPKSIAVELIWKISDIYAKKIVSEHEIAKDYSLKL